MTARGDTRRELLGEQLYREALESAREAPTPDPELLEQLSAILGRPVRLRVKRRAA